LEQVHDLQKQLQMEREESKKAKKRYHRIHDDNACYIVALVHAQKSVTNLMCYYRIQLLEAEQKRSSTPRRADSAAAAGAGPSAQELQAEVHICGHI
jgi:hypothetical protein